MYLISEIQPADLDYLRKWTSIEAIGEITVCPDSVPRINNSSTVQSNLSRDMTDDTLVTITSLDETPLDHQLPSPEEQQRVIAMK